MNKIKLSPVIRYIMAGGRGAVIQDYRIDREPEAIRSLAFGMESDDVDWISLAAHRALEQGLYE